MAIKESKMQTKHSGFVGMSVTAPNELLVWQMFNVFMESAMDVDTTFYCACDYIVDTMHVFELIEVDEDDAIVWLRFNVKINS